jgi:hypothetical protein
LNLSEMRDRIRTDLHDEDSSAYRWTDGELERHIQRAVRDFSLALPLETVAMLPATPGSREVSIGGLSEVVAIEAVEYPTGQYPACYIRYSVWLNTLTMLIEAAPSAAGDVAVYYTQLHTLDESSSTIPERFEDVIAGGAAGYAAVEWASFATNRVNVGGQRVWREYLAWGQERLADFQGSLASFGRRNKIRVVGMYVPASPPASESTVRGP